MIFLYLVGRHGLYSLVFQLWVERSSVCDPLFDQICLKERLRGKEQTLPQ
jgi:hypothetical protein